MEIQARLLITQNTETEHDDPHSIGIFEIPWDQIARHERLCRLRDALPHAEKRICEREGKLTLAVDYGFEKGYAGTGVGPVMRGLNVDLERLPAEHKASIQHWLQERYSAATQSDAELQAALDRPDVKDHATTDMTVACMSKAAFLKAFEMYKTNGECLFPLTSEDMEKIVASLETRGQTDLETYYTETAMAMRAQWPSPTQQDYIGKALDDQPSPDKAHVIFFKGFEAGASVTVRSASYAKAPTWPGADNGFDGYDHNGIARDKEGGIVRASNVVPAPKYNYYPHLALSATLDGEAATAAIDRWLDAAGSAPNYNGFSNNCVSGAGQIVFGNQYNDLIQKVAGIESHELGHAKVTNAMLRRGVLLGEHLPEGIDAAQVMVDPSKLAPDDSWGIGEALRQLSERDANQQRETAIVEAVGREEFQSHVDTLRARTISTSSKGHAARI